MSQTVKSDLAFLRRTLVPQIFMQLFPAFCGGADFCNISQLLLSAAFTPDR